MRALALLSLITCCGMDWLCENSVIPDLVAKGPGNSRLKAVTFQRDCGATTNFSFQVSIVDSSVTVPEGSGNLVVLGAGKHGNPIQAVDWISEHELEVRYSSDARVYKKSSDVEGITLKLVPVP